MIKNKTSSLKTKILLVLIVLSLINTAVFSYYFYIQMKETIIDSLDKHSKAVVYGANNILKEYHDKITGPQSISNKEYVQMLKRLSQFAKETDVRYIYSFMEDNGKVVYSSTSATDEEFKEKDYDPFYAQYKDASQKLKHMLVDKSMNIEFEEAGDEYGYFRSIFVPFKNKYGKKYIVGVDVEISYIQEILKQVLFEALSVGFVLFLLSIFVFSIVLHLFLRQIPTIKNGLEEFFKYLNKERDEIEFIPVNSNDELGEMARVINKNISITQENIIKDNLLIEDIQRVSKFIANGSFQYRVEAKAHSPALNEVKDVINLMLDNIQEVMEQVVAIIGEYSHDNYEVVVDKKEYADDFLELIESVNTLGSNISQEKLQNAYDSISIQKSANYLREFIEDIVYLFTHISKDITHLCDELIANERFNLKLQVKIDEALEEKAYIEKLLVGIKEKEDEFEFKQKVQDIEYSLHKFEEILKVVHRDIEHEIGDIKEIVKPLNLLNETIAENRVKAENTMKVASDLSAVSMRIRESIVASNFVGKENINIMMQYVDR